MNMQELGRAARAYVGSVHGECKLGTDIEFPSIVQASSFLFTMGWVDDAFLLNPVTDFTSTVVITVPNHKVKEWGTDEHLATYLSEEDA